MRAAALRVAPGQGLRVLRHADGEREPGVAVFQLRLPHMRHLPRKRRQVREAERGAEIRLYSACRAIILSSSWETAFNNTLRHQNGRSEYCAPAGRPAI